MILKLLLSLKFREKTKLQSFVSTNNNNYWYLLVTIGVFFLPKVSLNQFVLIKNNLSRHFNDFYMNINSYCYCSIGPLNTVF